MSSPNFFQGRDDEDTCDRSAFSRLLTLTDCRASLCFDCICFSATDVGCESPYSRMSTQACFSVQVGGMEVINQRKKAPSLCQGGAMGPYFVKQQPVLATYAPPFFLPNYPLAACCYGRARLPPAPWAAARNHAPNSLEADRPMAGFVCC